MEFSRQEYWTELLFPSPRSNAAAAAKSLQSCPTLCDPIDGSPPGSAVPGILQARTLEWVAIIHRAKYLEAAPETRNCYDSTLPSSGVLLNDPLLEHYLPPTVKNLSGGTVFKIEHLVRAQILGLKTEGFSLTEKIKSDDIWDPSFEKMF